MANLVDVDDANFENEVIKSDIPVLVDFSAPWCGPCKMIDPILKDLAHNEWSEKIKVVKINADENQGSVTRCGVMGLPTLLLFKKGKMVNDVRITGYKPKKKLMEEIEGHI
jgi:thioredoxin 1